MSKRSKNDGVARARSTQGKNRLLMLASLASAALLAPKGASAALITWNNGGTDGDWGTASNWTPATVPGLAGGNLVDTAEIDNAGTANISTGETFTPFAINIGNNAGGGFGALNMSGGSLSANGATSPSIVIANNGSQGEFDLTGGTVSAGTGEFWVGQGANANAIFNQSAGTLTVNNWLAVGRGDPASTGVVNLSGTGVINQTGGNHITLGSVNGNGTINQTGGTITTASAFYLSETGPGTVNLSAGTITTPTMELAVTNTTSNGLLNMSGGTITAATSFLIGNSGVGVWTMSGGAVTTPTVQLGINGGSSGTWNMTGGTVTTTNSVIVGSASTGTLNISGGTIISPSVVLGSVGGGSGILNLGTGGTLSTAGISAGTGTTTLNQLNLNGGLIKATAASANLISVPSNEVNVQGGGAFFDANGFASTIPVALNGSGGLTLQGTGNGGSLTLAVSNGYTGDTTVNAGFLILGAVGAAGGTNINLNGGAVAISNDTFIGGKTLHFNPGPNGIAGALQFQNYSSALSFDTGSVPNLTLGAALGAASTLSGQITGGGSLTFVGPGILNLANTANTYSGGTNVDAGVLQVAPGSLGSGAVNLNFTGTIGIGSDAALTGLPLVFNGGGITFNNYASTLNFNQGVNVTLGAAAGVASSLSGTISNGASPTSITYVGPGTLALTGTNTYTGGTTIAGGTLNFTTGALGTSGPIILKNAATLQYAASNTTDLTTGTTFGIGVAGGTLDIGANNVNFAGNIITDPALPAGTLSGRFIKTGTGTLTLNGNLTTAGISTKLGTVVLKGTSTVSTVTTPITNQNNFVQIGANPGDNSTLTLQNTSALTAAGDFNVGDAGNASVGTLSGTVNLQDSAALTVRTLFVGKFGNAVGTFNQSGGTVNQANNGAGGGEWRIGGGGSAADAAAVGIYNLTGGTLNAQASFQVGAFGTGTLTQTAGTATIGTQTAGPGTGGGFLAIGRFTGGTGLYDMSTGSGTLTANATPVAIVGEAGNGTLKVGGTSTVNVFGLSLSHAAGGVGLVLQTGGTINAPNGVSLGGNVGGAGVANATYNLSGGLLTTSAINGSPSTATTSVTTMFLNGGTIQATKAGATLISGLNNANVQTGGAIINTNGLDVLVNQQFKHDPTVGAPATDGGFTKTGLGTLSVTAATSNYTGPTTINGGTVKLVGGTNALPASGPVVMATGTTLDLNGLSQTVSTLNGASGSSVTLGTGTTPATAGSLTINFTSTTPAATYNGVISGNGKLTKSGTGIQTLGGADTFNGVIAVSGGTLNLGANPGTALEVRTVGGITLAAGTKITVGNAASHVNRTLLVTPIFTTGTGAKLDLNSNDIDFQTGVPTIATVTTLIKAGYTNGTWSPAAGTTAILSTAAANNTTHLTTLGSIVNNDGTGHTIYGTPIGTGTNLGLFDGTSPALNDVLVKYTYYGDANIDGQVDGSDYTKIDAAFGTAATGWANGDFNYDGKIDGSDYTLIDNAFNTQGGNLNTTSAALIASSAAQLGAGSASSAVPEPTTLGMLGVAAASLLGRRRRRI